MTITFDTPFADEPVELGSWRPVDLHPIADGFESGDLVGPQPTLLKRGDDVPLIYPGEIHSFSGEPESGKGWIALHLAAELIEAGKRVLYLDFEDSPLAIYERLRALGASRASILEHFDYVRPEDPPKGEIFAALVTTHALVVLDGVSEAYALVGLNISDNTDAASFLQRIVRPLSVSGAAVVQIDHVTKAKDGRGRYSLGAQHKLAGVAVAYTTHVIKPPSRQQAGLVKLRVEKDRHGHVRGHAQGKLIGEVRITPFEDGKRVTVTLDAPENAQADDGKFRPTVLMHRVADYLRENPGAGKRDVKYNVTGDRRYIPQALDRLVEEGYVEPREHGSGQRIEHHLVSPFLG